MNPSAEADERREFAKAHLALFVTAGVLITTAMRIAIVSGFNANSAAALLGAADPFRIVVGTFAAPIAPFALITTCALAVVLAWKSTIDAQFKVFVIVPTVVVGVLVLARLPWQNALITFGVGAMLGFLTGKRANDRRALLFVLGLSFLVFLLSLLLFTTNPWFPTEKIRFQDGTVTVGYVLERTDEWTTVMDHRTDLVTYRRTETLASREICQDASEFDGPSLFDPGDKRDRYSKCPLSSN